MNLFIVISLNELTAGGKTVQMLNIARKSDSLEAYQVTTSHKTGSGYFHPNIETVWL